jgi:hypothetical protein
LIKDRCCVSSDAGTKMVASSRREMQVLTKQKNNVRRRQCRIRKCADIIVGDTCFWVLKATVFVLALKKYGWITLNGSNDGGGAIFVG